MDIKVKVTEECKNLRVDDLISKSFDMISRNQAAFLVKNGDILVSERKTKPSYKVKVGEIISGSVVSRENICVLPQKIDLDIVFEDNYIIVINKMPGLIVHPGAGNASGTLVNALLHHCPKIADAGEDKSRAGIVHRLDKNTSGIMVAAKTRTALEFLKKEFKYRRVRKQYFALVKGVIKDDTGRITLPVGRHPQKRIIMTTKGDNLRSAETLFSVQQRSKNTTLVKVILKTGRTHQIRVHFYAIGYPLMGERVYQFRKLRKQKSSILRPMLHSATLKFRHPFSGKSMSFSTPLPDDFKDLLDTL
ncbi:MAG: RluA family pseudouridine synthase [Desulfobacteraceae bacterium]|nr:RluA family pseudouridine synthase [Desulfobacteraceae bacterium]